VSTFSDHLEAIRAAVRAAYDDGCWFDDSHGETLYEIELNFGGRYEPIIVKGEAV
jgi:hypothetical protein